MKRLFLLSLFLCTFSAFAGDWDLFPYKQRSYFMQPYTNGSNIGSTNSFCMDRIKSTGTSSNLYFNRSCEDSTFKHCYEWVQIQKQAVNSIDSLSEHNDTVFYFSQSSTQPFYLIKSAKVGQSWVISTTKNPNPFTEVTITCSTAKDENFLGIHDSVKTFTLHANTDPDFDNFTIKLSKNYGLIEFIPFEFFLDKRGPIYSCKLISLKKDKGSYIGLGFSLQDFFHLKSGDIQVWEDYVEPAINPSFGPTYSRYQDSIKQVLSTSDSVVYIVNRSSYKNGKLEVQSNIRVPYYRKQWDKFISANIGKWLQSEAITNPFIYSKNGFLWNMMPVVISTNAKNDSIARFTFITSFSRIDSASCAVIPTFDVSAFLKLSTELGLTYSEISNNMNHDGTRLISYRINGVWTGNPLVNVVEVPQKETITIYPNPCTTSIKIESSLTIKGKSYRIYDLLGQLIQEGQLTASIDVSNLQSSCYYLHITHNNTTTRQKFIKL